MSPARRRRGPLAGLLASLTRSRRARAGTTILALFAIAALLAPVISPGDPARITGAPASGPSPAHWLGVTPKGQDVLAMTLWGARSSLAVGLGAGVLATLVALVVGLTSAYLGRAVDGLLSVVTNVFLLLPGLPLLVVLAAYMPPGWASTLIVLVVTGWAGAARVLRAQAMSLRGTDFVEAAVVAGEGPVRIMAGEMLPNMASVVMSTLLGCVNAAIGAQAGLEFLGLGPSGSVSWGTNLHWAATDGALMTGRWWTFVPSGLAIALVAYALALINAGVDEATNPRLRRPTRGGPDVERPVTLPAHSAGPIVEDGGDHEPLLRIEDLSVEYGADGGERADGGRRVVGVDRFSLTVGPGEVMGLAGPSGCGKTTAAAAIMRLLGPTARVTSGRVMVGGRDVLARGPRHASHQYRSRVQMVFQDPFASLNPAHSVERTVGRALALHRSAPESGGGTDDQTDAVAEAARLLDAVGLEPGLLGARPHELSGGQRQRVAIARALACDPEVLVADEPTSMLDAPLRAGILDLLARLRQERGMSILYITHDLASARYLADTTAVLQAGRLVENGPTAELMKHPAHPYTRLLLSALPAPKPPAASRG